MKKIAIAWFIAPLFSTPLAHAHSFWINAFESHLYHSYHAMISLGWGHVLPMDNILMSPNARIAIDRFELLDPLLQKTDLLKPAFKLSEPELTTDNFDLIAADMGIQKVAFKEGSAKGVYQIGVATKPAFYTQYIDKSGKTKMKLKPEDELKDIQKVLMSVKYQAFAKSCLTVGQWTNPKPLGHNLEIIPLTDLSNLQVGALVEVDVRFHGQPLSASAKNVEYITAWSSSFGQSDGFCLMSYIMDGHAQFRVQSSGQWMVGVNHKDNVTGEGPLKDLYGKAEMVLRSASLTFTVK